MNMNHICNVEYLTFYRVNLETHFSSILPMRKLRFKIPSFITITKDLEKSFVTAFNNKYSFLSS